MKMIMHKTPSTYITETRKLVDDSIKNYLRKSANIPPKLMEALEWSIFGGGKRLRPLVAILTCEALGGKREDILPTACALELIHTYSLIHDDLPSMDNADIRRDRLSCHKKFGEAIAILTGDALQSLALEIMVRYTPNKKILPKLILEVAIRSGPSGMVGGQVLDIQGLISSSPTTLRKLYSLKTATLFIASVICGAISAMARRSKLQKLTSFGKNLGMAYQFQDDILDGETGAQHLTLPALNCVNLYGICKSKRIMKYYINKAKSSIKFLGRKGKYLCEIADNVLP